MKRQYRMVSRNSREKAPFPRPSFVLALTVLLVVGYGFYRFGKYLMNESQMFQLKQIQVEGINYLSEKEVLKLVEVKPGIQLFQVVTDSVKKRVLEHLYLNGVSVSRILPSTLNIAVQERQPFAYLVDGKIYMVDETGIILLKKPSMQMEGFPLITGLSVPKLLANRQPLLNAIELIKKVKQVDESLFEFISEIHIGHRTPPMFYLIRGGAKVILNEAEIYSQLYLLSKFMQKLTVLNKLDQIKKIDLRYSDRIVVTRKS